MVESDGTTDATRRLNVKKQTLDDAYAVPANFLEIDVVNPQTTMAAGKKRYTDYEVKMRVIIKNIKRNTLLETTKHTNFTIITYNAIKLHVFLYAEHKVYICMYVYM